MQPDDRTHVYIATDNIGAVREAEGIDTTPLYLDVFENIRLQTWHPNTQGEIDASGGTEVLMLGDTIIVDEKSFSRGHGCAGAMGKRSSSHPATTAQGSGLRRASSQRRRTAKLGNRYELEPDTQSRMPQCRL